MLAKFSNYAIYIQYTIYAANRNIIGKIFVEESGIPAVQHSLFRKKAGIPYGIPVAISAVSPTANGCGGE